jgi:hypothetical protein
LRIEGMATLDMVAAVARLEPHTAPKAAAGEDGGHRQAAAAVAEEGIGDAVEFGGQSGPGHQVSHQDEQAGTMDRV